MPANKQKRLKSVELDMNPMVDMAFLLVTFFLLATTFKTPEPTQITLPRSISKLDLPENKVVTISVSKSGAAFIGISDPEIRMQLLDKFASTYSLPVDQSNRLAFSTLPGIGVPAKELCEFLSISNEARQLSTQPGIPRDSANNELADWIIYARTLIPDARFAIKADKRTPYHDISNIIKTLTDNNILRFNLITEIRRIDGI